MKPILLPANQPPARFYRVNAGWASSGGGGGFGRCRDGDGMGRNGEGGDG